MAEVHDESGTWCGRYLAMKPKQSPPLAAWYLGHSNGKPMKIRYPGRTIA